MRAIAIGLALLALAIYSRAETREKPRVFVTESNALQGTGNADVGDARGSLTVTGGTSPQNVEAMKAFARYWGFRRR